MQFLALLVFLGVAFFGFYLLKRRKSNKIISRWMINTHGIVGVVGLVLLIIGQFESWSWASNWGWISALLFAALLVFGFLLFGKWFKEKKTPYILIMVHGCFACMCIGVLTYSLVIVN